MVCLGLGIDGEESTEEEVVINESNDVNENTPSTTEEPTVDPPVPIETTVTDANTDTTVDDMEQVD